MSLCGGIKGCYDNAIKGNYRCFQGICPWASTLFCCILNWFHFFFFENIKKPGWKSSIKACTDRSSAALKHLTGLSSESLCVIKAIFVKIDIRLKWLKARQTPAFFLLSFPPPLMVSRPALPRTSVGTYPPLNRSRRATAGSLTAQYGSSINQRHFQCPITETLLLGLSEADSSPIHLGGGEGKKAIVARHSPLPVQTAGC